jgi:hypothetical protein
MKFFIYCHLSMANIIICYLTTSLEVLCVMFEQNLLFQFVIVQYCHINILGNNGHNLFIHQPLMNKCMVNFKNKLFYCSLFPVGNLDFHIKLFHAHTVCAILNINELMKINSNNNEFTIQENDYIN